jgi:hypothetical protein
VFQVGSLLGSILIAIRNFTPKVRRLVGFTFVAFIGLFFIAFSPEGVVEIMALGTFIIGFSIAFIDVGFITLLQTHIPQELQGRIFSITFTLVKSILPIALLFIGGLAEIVPLEIIYFICPTLGIFLVIYLAFIANLSSLDSKLAPSFTSQPV